MFHNLISQLSRAGIGEWGLIAEEERNYWTNQAWGWFNEDTRRIMFLGGFSPQEQSRLVLAIAASFRRMQRNYDSFIETLQDPVEAWGLNDGANPYAGANRPLWLERDAGIN